MSITRLMDISSRALITYQQALSVTSNNVANSGNANYTRQRAVLASEYSDHQGVLNLGAGVRLADVQRIKDNMTDEQLRLYYQQNSMYSKQSDYLSQVEATLSEPGADGVSNLLNKFYNSWNDASVNPSSIPLRNSIVQTAQQLSAKIQSIYDGMNNMRPDLLREANSQVDSINTYVKQINTLNGQIYAGSIVGTSPNDLMDQRDQAINELSKLVNINVSYDQNNVASVSIGGMLAADKVTYAEFKAVDENGTLKIKTKDDAATLAIQGGELAAVMNTYSQDIPNMIKQLNTVVAGLVTQVNDVHASGYTNTNPPKTGVKFFESFTDGVLKISNDVLSDVKNIALSADGTVGNNAIALKLSALKDAKLENGKTIAESYSEFVTDMGGAIQKAQQNTDSTQAVISQLQQQKENYSGVSVDEEMINIMKYQRSYQAAARLIKTADDMFQSLLQVV